MARDRGRDAAKPRASPDSMRIAQVSASHTSAQSNGSSAYPLSSRFQSSLSDLSQSSSGTSALDYTPPTSQSQVEATSSQDSVVPSSHQSRSSGRYRVPSQPAPIDTAPRTVNGHSAISTPTSSDSSSPVHGSKRLADGQFKPVTPGSNLSPIGGKRGAHSRNTSLDSSVSRVAELSADLKARLSYAKIKVQNGWEREPFDEVERLSSQRSSPTSSSARLRSDSQLSQTPHRDVDRARPCLQSNLNARNPFPSSPRSFLQDPAAHMAPDGHNLHCRGASGSSSQDARRGATSGPSLEPAPELVPARHGRRSATACRQPPPMPSNSLAAQKQGSQMTSTPTRAEQEAVDTLLFMSSPANSAAFSNRPAAPMSPPKAEPLRHMEPESSELRPIDRAHQKSYAASKPRYGKGQTNTSRFGQIKTKQDVEKLLDEMGDSSSNEGEDSASRRDLPGSHQANSTRGFATRPTHIRM